MLKTGGELFLRLTRPTIRVRRTMYGAKASCNKDNGLHGDVHQDERSRTTISSYESG